MVGYLPRVAHKGPETLGWGPVRVMRAGKGVDGEFPLRPSHNINRLHADTVLRPWLVLVFVEGIDGTVPV